MKKTITSLLLIFILSNFAQAQSEPEAIKTKDLIDKLDRSELSTDETNPTLDNIMPDFEMPTIDFKVSKEKTTKPKTNKTHTQKIKAKTTATSVQNKSDLNKTNKVVFAKKPLTIGQLLKKDKIVISNGITYVYRLKNKIITQYKIKDKIPLKSLGLKTSGKNSFYVIDATLLKKDAKNLRSRNNKIKNKSSTRSKRKSTKMGTKKAVEKMAISPEVLAKRKLVEEKFNHGRIIERSITLKKLLVNDTIVITQGIQLVIRKNQTTSGGKKYWLTEKIDINNKSLQKKSNNVYKLIRTYR